jgi:tetratricopeptide (TPR) repeat protein
MIDPQIVTFVRDAVLAGIAGNAAYDGLQGIFQPIFGNVWKTWHKEKPKEEDLEKKIIALLEKNPEKKNQIEHLQIYQSYQNYSGTGNNIINNYLLQLQNPSVLDNHILGKAVHGITTFTGREKELEELQDLLLKKESNIILLMNGLGGIGKTTIAKQIVSKYLADTLDHICWIDYQKSLQDSFLTQIAHTYDLRKYTPDELFYKIITDLNNLKGNNLLVIDGFDNKYDENAITHLPSNFKTLITSRINFQSDTIIAYKLDVLSPNEAKKLFCTYWHETDNEREKGELNELLGKIGYHTLALEIMAKTLRKDDEIKSLKDLLKLEGNMQVHTANPKAAAATLENFLTQLFEFNDLSKEEISLLQNFSILPSFDIAQTEMLDYLQINGSVRDRYKQAMHSLADGGWLIRTIKKKNEGKPRNYFRCHQMVQTFIKKHKIYAPQVKDCLPLIDSFIALLDSKPEENPLNSTVYIPYTEAILEGLQEDHVKISILTNNLAMLYRSLGDFPKALFFINKALAIYEKVLPVDHPYFATSYNNISLIYQAMGDIPNALSFANKTLAICEKALPDDHPYFAISYNNLGTLYQAMGDIPNALSFANKALDICEKVLPVNHPYLAISYNNLSMLYQIMGDIPNALSFANKALDICEKVLPVNHPYLAISYNNTGTLYQTMGDIPKAFSFTHKALVIREKVLPSDHPDLAMSYNNLSEIYQAIGDLSKVFFFANKALVIREKVLSSDHPDLAMSYNNLAAIYYDRKEYSEAKKYMQKTIAILEKNFPNGHPNLDNARRWMEVIEEEL